MKFSLRDWCGERLTSSKHLVPALKGQFPNLCHGEDHPQNSSRNGRSAGRPGRAECRSQIDSTGDCKFPEDVPVLTAMRLQVHMPIDRSPSAEALINSQQNGIDH